jgi:hypothetical protein
MTPSPLDRAFAAAEADETDAARLRAYALMLETDLRTPLRADDPGAAPDAPLRPLVFDLSDGPMALAFDDDGRMADFFGAPTEYAALPGRALVALLAEAGLGLALNPDTGAAALDGETLRWIARELIAPPDSVALSGALRVGPPTGAAPDLLAALAARIAAAPGFIAEAWLVRLGPDDAPGELTLAFLPNPAARRAADGLAAMLAACAEPHAPPGERVATGALAPDGALLAAARAQGVALHAPSAVEAAAKSAPAAVRTPPRLR